MMEMCLKGKFKTRNPQITFCNIDLVMYCMWERRILHFDQNSKRHYIWITPPKRNTSQKATKHLNISKQTTTVLLPILLGQIANCRRCSAVGSGSHVYVTRVRTSRDCYHELYSVRVLQIAGDQHQEERARSSLWAVNLTAERSDVTRKCWYGFVEILTGDPWCTLSHCAGKLGEIASISPELKYLQYILYWGRNHSV